MRMGFLFCGWDSRACGVGGFNEKLLRGAVCDGSETGACVRGCRIALVWALVGAAACGSLACLGMDWL